MIDSHLANSGYCTQIALVRNSCVNIAEFTDIESCYFDGGFYIAARNFTAKWRLKISEQRFTFYSLTLFKFTEAMFDIAKICAVSFKCPRTDIGLREDRKDVEKELWNKKFLKMILGKKNTLK